MDGSDKRVNLERRPATPMVDKVILPSKYGASMSVFGRLFERDKGIYKLTPHAVRDGVAVLNALEVKENRLGVVELPDGIKIGVIKRGGDFRVFGLQCPHMGGDLSGGRYCSEDRTLQCPWHGYVFELQNGRMINNPNVEMMQKARIKTKHFDPDAGVTYHMRRYPATVVGSELDVQIEKGGR
jgi:nitrite reductase/ring-hydroxylating ferredoxin subunit